MKYRGIDATGYLKSLLYKDNLSTSTDSLDSIGYGGEAEGNQANNTQPYYANESARQNQSA